MSSRVLRGLLALAAVLAAFSAAPSSSKPLYNQPVYEPTSKSYFELVELERGVNWHTADKLARQRVFKNVHGRLAVVRHVETHSFLMQTFQPTTYTFIGLRYACKTRRAYWSTGETFKTSDFHAWARQWDESAGVGCQEGDMPIAYSGAHEGFRWIGKGGLKVYSTFFVEYPTGKP